MKTARQPTNLSESIAATLSKANAKGAVAREVEAFIRRVGPDLIEEAKKGRNPFAGAEELTKDWHQICADGSLERRVAGEAGVPAIPTNARADFAPELRKNEALMKAADASVEVRNDPQVQTAMAQLRDAVKKQGFTLVGIGLSGSTPMIVYSSAHVDRVLAE